VILWHGSKQEPRTKPATVICSWSFFVHLRGSMNYIKIQSHITVSCPPPEPYLHWLLCSTVVSIYMSTPCTAMAVWCENTSSEAWRYCIHKTLKNIRIPRFNHDQTQQFRPSKMSAWHSEEHQNILRDGNLANLATKCPSICGSRQIEPQGFLDAATSAGPTIGWIDV
jgi:hypothetical protein